MKYLLILEEYKESLDYLLRKHPKYIPLFKKFENEPFERLNALYHKLNTNRELYHFNQISNMTTYEQVDDFISKLIIDNHNEYDIKKILNNGLIDYFIKCVDSGYIDPSADDNYAITWAAYNGHLDVVRYLMSLPKKYGIDPSADGNYAIKRAAYNGHLDIVKYLMSLPKEYGIDPSVNDNYAIRWAAESGYLDLVKYLMSLPKEYGIDPSARNNFAIKWAASGGHLDVVKYLMSLPKEYGIDPSVWNRSARRSLINSNAIQLAAENAQYNIVEYLLSLDIVKSTLSKEEYEYYSKICLHKKFSWS